MNMSLNIRNAFGGAETLSGNASYAIDTNGPIYNSDSNDMAGASAYQATFTTPINGDPDHKIEIQAFRQSRNHMLLMSHHERITGMTFKLKNWLGLTKQEFSYDAIWRENHNLSPSASFSIRNDAGHSLKSAITHSLSFDSRDDAMLPSRGLYWKAFQEIAGIGGDVRHIKAEVDSQISMPLPLGFSVSASVRGGVLAPWGGSRTRINDRFFLGGPLSLRGFKQSGVGPKDGNDSLGGDLYWAAGLSLLLPLPIVDFKTIKAHVFVNGGSLAPIQFDKSPAANAHALFGTPSIGAGFGLVAKFTIFRLELNYGIPLTAVSSDSVKTALQFGIGMNFM
eukprot:jgi/Hompol1/6291/HPOL_004919-RA